MPSSLMGMKQRNRLTSDGPTSPIRLTPTKKKPVIVPKTPPLSPAPQQSPSKTPASTSSHNSSTTSKEVLHEVRVQVVALTGVCVGPTAASSTTTSKRSATADATKSMRAQVAVVHHQGSPATVTASSKPLALQLNSMSATSDGSKSGNSSSSASSSSHHHGPNYIAVWNNKTNNNRKTQYRSPSSSTTPASSAQSMMGECVTFETTLPVNASSPLPPHRNVELIVGLVDETTGNTTTTTAKDASSTASSSAIPIGAASLPLISAAQLLMQQQHVSGGKGIHRTAKPRSVTLDLPVYNFSSHLDPFSADTEPRARRRTRLQRLVAARSSRRNSNNAKNSNVPLSSHETGDIHSGNNNKSCFMDPAKDAAVMRVTVELVPKTTAPTTADPAEESGLWTQRQAPPSSSPDSPRSILKKGQQKGKSHRGLVPPPPLTLEDTKKNSNKNKKTDVVMEPSIEFVMNKTPECPAHQHQEWWEPSIERELSTVHLERSATFRVKAMDETAAQTKASKSSAPSKRRAKSSATAQSDNEKVRIMDAAIEHVWKVDDASTRSLATSNASTASASTQSKAAKTTVDGPSNVVNSAKKATRGRGGPLSRLRRRSKSRTRDTMQESSSTPVSEAAVPTSKVAKSPVRTLLASSKAKPSAPPSATKATASNATAQDKPSTGRVPPPYTPGRSIASGPPIEESNKQQQRNPGMPPKSPQRKPKIMMLPGKTQGIKSPLPPPPLPTKRLPLALKNKRSSSMPPENNIGKLREEEGMELPLIPIVSTPATSEFPQHQKQHSQGAARSPDVDEQGTELPWSSPIQARSGASQTLFPGDSSIDNGPTFSLPKAERRSSRTITANSESASENTNTTVRTELMGTDQTTKSSEVKKSTDSTSKAGYSGKSLQAPLLEAILTERFGSTIDEDSAASESLYDNGTVTLPGSTRTVGMKKNFLGMMDMTPCGNNLLDEEEFTLGEETLSYDGDTTWDYSVRSRRKETLQDDLADLGVLLGEMCRPVQHIDDFDDMTDDDDESTEDWQRGKRPARWTSNLERRIASTFPQPNFGGLREESLKKGNLLDDAVLLQKVQADGQGSKTDNIEVAARSMKDIDEAAGSEQGTEVDVEEAQFTLANFIEEEKNRKDTVQTQNKPSARRRMSTGADSTEARVASEQATKTDNVSKSLFPPLGDQTHKQSSPLRSKDGVESAQESPPPKSDYSPNNVMQVPTARAAVESDKKTFAQSFVEMVSYAITPVPDPVTSQKSPIQSVPSTFEANEVASVGDLTATTYEMQVEIEEYKRQIEGHVLAAQSRHTAFIKNPLEGIFTPNRTVVTEEDNSSLIGGKITVVSTDAMSSAAEAAAAKQVAEDNCMGPLR